MPDTQWPRYMVFQQFKEGEPLEHAGTVHAVDPEMALQNGRDVFVRRPDCVSLWVVRAERILSMTPQEIADEDWGAINEGGNTSALYHVFQKRKHQGQCVQIGQVEATSDMAAMKKAVNQFSDEKSLFWWVFPEAAVSRSTSDDIESMFAPAEEKPYRHQIQFSNSMFLRQKKHEVEEAQTQSTKKAAHES